MLFCLMQWNRDRWLDWLVQVGRERVGKGVGCVIMTAWERQMLRTDGVEIMDMAKTYRTWDIPSSSTCSRVELLVSR